MHILPMNKMSGAEKMALLICSNFKEYEPIVICGGDTLKKAFNNIDSYSLSFSKTKMFKTLSSMKKIIKQNDVNILHCHDNTASLYGYLVKKLYKLDVKVISHIHNCYPFLKEEGINKKIDKLLRPKYDFNITCGSKVYDFYKKHADYFQESKYAKLSNAMDIEGITKVDDIEIEKVIKQYDIPKDKKILGFIGRLSEQKGILPFINEFAKQKDNFKDCKVLLVGDGDQEEKVKALLKDLDIEDMFILTGFQEDVYKFYPIIDVFFLPSLYEGLPMVLLEAMAFKKPIVSMDVGSINEIINIDTGALINKGAYKDLIKKLEKVKDDKVVADKYAINGYNFIKNRYDIKTYVNKLEKIYNKF